jgi:hypothetical protein
MFDRFKSYFSQPTLEDKKRMLIQQYEEKLMQYEDNASLSLKMADHCKSTLARLKRDLNPVAI